MTGYEHHKPFTRLKSTRTFMSFVAIDVDAIPDYGQHVRATELSNVDYTIRFDRFESRNSMNAPPDCKNFTSGYLVIGKPGTRNQFEDWLPDHVFEQIYKKVKPEYVAFFPSFIAG